MNHRGAEAQLVKGYNHRAVGDNGTGRRSRIVVQASTAKLRRNDVRKGALLSWHHQNRKLLDFHAAFVTFHLLRVLAV